MGMVKREVQDTPATPTTPPPSPALPAFSSSAAGSLPNHPASVSPKSPLNPTELGKVKAGVAHDAATITAAMSAMKTDDEVKALFSTLYHHILAVVLG